MSLNKYSIDCLQAESYLTITWHVDGVTLLDELINGLVRVIICIGLFSSWKTASMFSLMALR